MKHKKIFILIILLILILAIIFFTSRLFLKNNIIIATTSEEERIFWDNVLKNSPYIGEIKNIYPIEMLNDRTEILKIALATDDVKIEYINEEDISKKFVLTEGDGYKKSKKEISKYLKSLLNMEKFQYNVVNTYSENGEYIIMDEEYVYFTKIKVPEKIYIAINYKAEDEKYEVEIYEYLVTEENRSELEEMLKTGEISSKIEKNNNYKIRGTYQGDKIKINYKYTNEQDLYKVYELTGSLPEGVNIIN